MRRTVVVAYVLMGTVVAAQARAEVRLRVLDPAGAAVPGVIVGCGGEQEVVAELTRSWRPDLVLVGMHARHGLERNSERAAYDVLTIQSNRPSFAGRMINALAAAL